MFLKLNQWAVYTSLILIIMAMFVYPGGTLRNHGADRYVFFQNSLSDLGMTVTHAGRSNELAARLFTASFGLLALPIVGCTAWFVRFHASSSRSRTLAWAGGVGGLVVGVSLLGTALTPANLSPMIHMRFATWASAAAPISLLLLAAAAARDARASQRVSIAWVVLAGTCAAWFAMRWGPSVATDMGLTIQATAQKLVATVVVAVVLYQMRQAGTLQRASGGAG